MALSLASYRQTFLTGAKSKTLTKTYIRCHTPTSRYTLVEEVVGMILYLSSDLGSNIVGEVVPVDGGWTLG